MASLEKRTNGQSYRVVFMHGGQKIARSLKTNDLKTAKATVARLEDNLRRVELGVLQIPEGSDLATFLLSDGRLPEKPKATERPTLKSLFSRFFDSLPEGANEETTIDGMRIHERHLFRHLGEAFDVQALGPEDLQRYIEKRSREKGQHGRKVTGTTIKKAIVTLRTVWNWGVDMKILEGSFPGRGLKYPKSSEKPPFQTRAEIERQVKMGALTGAEEAELWECLYLTLPEVDEILVHVKESARHAFLHPMFVLAAHSGARRSEMMRSRLSDIDFDSKVITIRERKKAHDKTTTRRVPMSSTLSGVLKDWIAAHPGGPFTFTLGSEVVRSKKSRTGPGALTHDEANDHFKRAVNGTKWEKLRGWHVFRHSFISNCASRGIDQRFIDQWVGHLSEDIKRRYRHLLPDQQQLAMRSVFG